MAPSLSDSRIRCAWLGSGYLLPAAQLNSSTRSSRPTSPVPIFVAYGTPCEETLDPLVRNLESLRAELLALEARVSAMSRSTAAE